MSKKDDFIARLAVGSVDGANSAIIRIWSPKDKSDVYAGIREIAGEIKISLHEDGNCHAGLTTSFFTNQYTDTKLALGGGRHQSKWTRPTHLGARVVAPLQFAIPMSELRSWRQDQVIAEEAITWIDPPASDRSIIISCLFSGQQIPDTKWPGRQNQTHLVGSKCLPNGEKFWLLWQDCPTSDIERSILSNARDRVSKTKIVPFSGREALGVAPRRLIFKEFKEDRFLLVVAGAA